MWFDAYVELLAQEFERMMKAGFVAAQLENVARNELKASRNAMRAVLHACLFV